MRSAAIDTKRGAAAAASGDSSPDVIRDAALAVFAEHGFDGSSIREVAAKAGMSIAGLYHHFRSKGEILFDLMSRTMDDLTVGAESASAVGGAPRARLEALVRAHVLFHTERRAESFVSNTELRALDAEHRAKIMEKRDAYQRLFEDVIAEGAAGGEFGVEDVGAVARAVITMCTAVASWYRTDGPSTPDEIARLYGGLALRIVGARGTSNGRRRQR